MRDTGIIIKATTDNTTYQTGQIYWVNLNGEGHIQNGWHPGIIVQCNKGNKHSPTIAIVPVTSKRKTSLPTHVYIQAGLFGLSKPSIAQCEGQRIVSKDQIGDYIGMVSAEFMKKIAIGCLINTPYLQYLNNNDITNIKDFSSRKTS